MRAAQRAAADLREHICYVERSLEVLGGKWALLLIHELLGGVKRFSELRRAIPEASAKILTARLRDLEMAGVIERDVFDAIPPHVEYRLTLKGYALQDAIEALRVWGVTFFTDDPAPQLDPSLLVTAAIVEPASHYSADEN